MSNRGDLTGGPKIVEIDGKKYLEIVYVYIDCQV